MNKSIKKNFAYSSILTVSNYIFPLIIFPYISRVLGVTNIGICNFVDGIIGYYTLFAMMGINILGVREIAKCNNNRTKLNQTFSNLFLLNSITTIIALGILLLSMLVVPKLQEYQDLVIVGAVKIIFSFFLIEWFYKGIEEFQYITVRSVLTKLIYIILVFIFVNKESDYKLFYILSTLMIVANSLFNMYYCRKFVTLSCKEFNITLYLKSFFTLGLYLFFVSMYISFNVVYLGFVSGETEVGYYTVATKVYSVLISLFTALTGVMLPKMSILIAENKTEKFEMLIKKTIDILFSFTLPIIVIFTVFAPQVIMIAAGPNYEGAIIPMRIIMCLMLIIGYEQIIVIQILMPLNRDKIIIINSLLGATVSLIMNILLVKTYQSIGSAIAWVSAEVITLYSAQFFVTKYTGIKFPFRILVCNLMYAIPAFLICIIILNILKTNLFMAFLLGGLSTIIYYVILQLKIIKNGSILHAYNYLLKPIKKIFRHLLFLKQE